MERERDKYGRSIAEQEHRKAEEQRVEHLQRCGRFMSRRDRERFDENFNREENERLLGRPKLADPLRPGLGHNSEGALKPN